MKNVEEREDKTILFEAMRARDMKQTELADALGIKQPSLSGNMHRTRMGLDVFVKILNAMDYDVVVKDRRSGEDVWQVKSGND